MPFQNNLIAGASGAGGAYEIDYSCRFNDDDSAYLYRTPSEAGNQKTWTWSSWIKGQKAGTQQGIFWTGVGTGATSRGGLYFNTIDQFGYVDVQSSAVTIQRVTVAKYRDPSAWYHVVAVQDTTESSDSDKFKLWVNGEAVTDWTANTTNLSTNDDTLINATTEHRIGRFVFTTDYYADLYLSEIHFIDGTALTEASFGETNDDGVWVPKKYSGSYGTNGFFLEFGTNSALGDDTSGNTNDYTSSGLAAADQMTDTPTDNFCTINPNIPDVAGQNTANLSEGNLKIVATASSLTYRNPGTMLLNNGKWYWEGKVIGAEGGSDYSMLGIYSSSTALGTATVGGGAALANEWLLRDNGDAQHDGGGSSTGLGDFAVNDIIQIALDMDAKKMWFGKQNTFDGDPAAGTGESFSGIDTNIVPLSIGYGGGSGQGNWLMNFGQSSFAYTPPTGFNAVSTANLAAPTLTDPSTNFQTELYTGDGTAIGSGGKAVTFSGNSAMQPDIVWIKNREQTDNHELYDAARGTTKQLEMNNTNTETTESEGVTTFGSDGFTVGNLVGVNTNLENYVAWCWAAGNSGASNTVGSINTTTTYVDTTAGISISTYTGNDTDGATVGHGLGVTPATVWVLPRSNGDHHLASNWEAGVTAYSEKLKLNDTEGASSSTQVTAASSTTFTLGTDPNVNGSLRTYLAYCFAEVEGFSRFGTYTGNGNADGPFAYCGFKPEMVILKSSSTDGTNWEIRDVKRTTSGNPITQVIYINLSQEEMTTDNVDFLSNGFKVRSTGSGRNDDGLIYIFAAFAENPFGGDGVAPATAR